MKLIWAAAVVAFMVASAQAKPVLDWPSPLPPREPKVGQWVTYVSTTGERTNERIYVVAIDACGTWISWTTWTAARSTERLICVTREGRMTSATSTGDHGPPRIVPLPDETVARIRMYLEPPAAE